MALDIGLLDADGRRDLRLQLDDDALYWSLHPWWARVAEATGQYLDLYGDARFSGDALDVLDAALADAEEKAHTWPERQMFPVGTSYKRDSAGSWVVARENHEPLERAAVLAALGKFRALIAEARASGATLYGWGD